MRRKRSLLAGRLLFLYLGISGLLIADTACGDFLDDAEQKLTITLFDKQLRLKLSGTIDLEDYYAEKPAPGLIYSAHRNLFNPRATIYLDAQLGANIFGFVQARLDRGFDPTDGGVEVRLDEYALRLTPWRQLNLSIQGGKFGTVVGNWVPRHYSWDNPFVTAPLPYENLTGIWDSSAVDEVNTLLYWGHVPYDGITRFGDGYSDKVLRLPVIWGPSYASGVSLSGSIGKADFAFEVKNSALASRPESWDLTQVGFDNPTVSGRIGFTPSPVWNFGFSGSAGAYLRPEAASSLPPRDTIGDYREIVLGQDISVAWHRFQFWAEIFETRFEVPNVGDADVLSYYLEAKYKMTSQLFVAGRWNQQLYGTVPKGNKEVQWGNNAARIDAVIGYRVSTSLQAKLQYSFTHFDQNEKESVQLLATQVTFRF
jgi:hypothetical protein